MAVTEALDKRRATIEDYLRIARLDHATKHIFVLPGIALAWLLRGVQSTDVVFSVVLGFVCVVCIASANYVINEWLDRDFDRHHPTKSARAAVQAELQGRYVFLLWAVLAAIGLQAAATASGTMFAVALVFLSQGVFYNVRPLRTKDRPYLDVVSEAINNPLRLMIGWAMIDPTSLPPFSIIAAYWVGGAFLMAAKRYSEYRQIVASHGRDLLVRYRRSFAGYTESALLISCFVYALLAVSALAVFFVKYRIEYMIAFPVLIAMFGQYLSLSMGDDSAAQKPEKLYREKKLLAIVAALSVVFVVFTFVDVPALESLASQHFIELQ
ncbi:MAG: UbiA family prenyltransferase [Pseudomonadota bacterium]